MSSITWDQRVLEELACRASIPDICGAPSFAKRHWRDAARSLGFAFAIAGCSWADEERGLDAFRGADARLEQSDGPTPLHIDCARDSAPQALERALARSRGTRG